MYAILMFKIENITIVVSPVSFYHAISILMRIVRQSGLLLAYVSVKDNPNRRAELAIYTALVATYLSQASYGG